MRDNALLRKVTITLLNKTNGKETKKREDYGRRTFGPYSPVGLNIEDSV